MTFFTQEEFSKKYQGTEYESIVLPAWKIEAVSEMIYSQIGLRYRDASWTPTNVPLSIKNATLEQMRFMLDHDLPFVDIDKKIKAGNMDADIKSDYSTLALRILANAGYLYRGSRITDNMALSMPWGD